MCNMIVKLGVINHVTELSRLSMYLISEGAGVLVVMENSDENYEKLVFP